MFTSDVKRVRILLKGNDHNTSEEIRIKAAYATFRHNVNL